MAVILMDFVHTYRDNSNPGIQWLPTVAVWTQKKFFPLLTRPQGAGVPRVSKHTFFLQMKLFSICAKIAPKKHKFPKTIKIEERISKKL
jgi:hypothetical protein